MRGGDGNGPSEEKAEETVESRGRQVNTSRSKRARKLMLKKRGKIQLEDLQAVFEVDWKLVTKTEGAVLETLQVRKWKVKFYSDEPDPTPPEWPDRPRLDVVITWTDGRWVRWHISGDLIWSTEDLPTVAMRMRYNRMRKLLKQREKEQTHRMQSS